MQTREQKAETARRNGAQSQGPVTPEGKEHSARNAIKHGRRAGPLALLVPPQSGVLANEDRQSFYTLYDQNIAKYRPADPAELAIAREITDCQWANGRIALTRNAMLNRELVRNHEALVPTLPELRDVENTAAAYETLAASRAFSALRRDQLANTRLIVIHERRLHFIQKTWPAQAPAAMNSDADRAENLVEVVLPGATPPPAPERTQVPAPVEDLQTVDNTEESTPISKKIRLDHLTAFNDETIALYQALFPGRDLSFEFFDDIDQPKAA